MNCFAGLAWMNSAPCHLPKTRKMKTRNEHKPDEATKQLFSQLFELQWRLERQLNSSDHQVQLIIVLIDELLGTMLDSFDE